MIQGRSRDGGNRDMNLRWMMLLLRRDCWNCYCRLLLEHVVFNVIFDDSCWLIGDGYHRHNSWLWLIRFVFDFISIKDGSISYEDLFDVCI